MPSCPVVRRWRRWVVGRCGSVLSAARWQTDQKGCSDPEPAIRLLTCALTRDLHILDSTRSGITDQPGGGLVDDKKVGANGSGSVPDDDNDNPARRPPRMMTLNQPGQRYRPESYTGRRSCTLLVEVQRPGSTPAVPLREVLPMNHSPIPVARLSF